ncbi:CaiB/BaiF CoA transferase family protein [uncultured Jatrophihabitans sp.]|uniref:CaiB/BaiF CoA transferase family protein n=1 Tax=uncultured Jatrophihabitans sp. TaxID=1610747 RepID=UPI0035CC3F5D
MSTSTPTASLAGLRVLELGHIIGGPFCGHLFADHGAEVIKVEPPAGDPMREWGGLYKGVGLYWSIIGRGKKSVTLDLRTAAGQRAALELARTADVVVENFRPGTLERWNLGWARLSAVNPGLILVRITGFGQDGPYRDRAGFGSVAEAMSGFRQLSGEPGRPPVRVGVSLGDALAGTQGFVGALLALYRRDRPGGTGRGQVVDVALYEAMWMYMESTVAEYVKLGTVRQPTGSTLPGVAPSNVYPTADGDWVVIGANQDSVFGRLAGAAGRPEWIAPGADYATHLGRGRHQARLDAEIAEWTAAFSADVLLARLADAGVPAGRIYTARDIVDDPHYAAREMVVDVPEPALDGETLPMPGIVPKLSDSPGALRRGAPLLGEHNAELLGERAADDTADSAGAGAGDSVAAARGAA